MRTASRLNCAPLPKPFNWKKSFHCKHHERVAKNILIMHFHDFYDEWFHVFLKSSDRLVKSSWIEEGDDDAENGFPSWKLTLSVSSLSGLLERLLKFFFFSSKKMRWKHFVGCSQWDSIKCHSDDEVKSCEKSKSRLSSLMDFAFSWSKN